MQKCNGILFKMNVFFSVAITITYNTLENLMYQLIILTLFPSSFLLSSGWGYLVEKWVYTEVLLRTGAFSASQVKASQTFKFEKWFSYWLHFLNFIFCLILSLIYVSVDHGSYVINALMHLNRIKGSAFTHLECWQLSVSIITTLIQLSSESRGNIIIL